MRTGLLYVVAAEGKILNYRVNAFPLDPAYYQRQNILQFHHLQRITSDYIHIDSIYKLIFTKSKGCEIRKNAYDQYKLMNPVYLICFVSFP